MAVQSRSERERAHRSGVDGQLRSSEERESVNGNFEPSRVEVVDGVEVQISDQHVCSNLATSLSANSCCSILEWKTPCAQDPGDWTRRPVMAKAVEETAVPAWMCSQGEGHPKAPQEQDSERLTINSEGPQAQERG